MSCSVCAGHDTYNCPCCSEEVNMIECPDCKGTGEGDYKVFDRIDRIAVRCDKIAYYYSPDDEDAASAMGRRYCRLSCTCQTCKGEGEIPENY